MNMAAPIKAMCKDIMSGAVIIYAVIVLISDYCISFIIFLPRLV